jgi:hypothetical protein
MKTFEKFTDDEIKKFLDEIKSNKNKPKLKVGDIVDLQYWLI